MHVSDLLSSNNCITLTAVGVPRIIATERTYRLACWSMFATSRLVTTGSVLGYCGTDWSWGQQNPVLPTLFLPPVNKLYLRQVCVLRTCFYLLMWCAVRDVWTTRNKTYVTDFIWFRKFVFRINVIYKRSQFVHCNIIKMSYSWRGACWSTEVLYLPEPSVSLLHR